VCAGSRGIIILYTFSELRLDHTKDVLCFCHCEAAGWIFLHVVEASLVSPAQSRRTHPVDTDDGIFMPTLSVVSP
jgi:hypothetical protein